jgi:hypothetical protein
VYNKEDEALIAEIMPVLEIDHQYVRTVDGWNDDLTAQIRRCGRAAARRLGYKVRTFATDPREREDHRRLILIAVTASTPADEARIDERSQLLIELALGRALG